ncbi:MAG TPA: RuBisCO large subunit C-terminal-like domain-containing protein [Casimicrobiaceae bacterium]|nr:RuBisCO large subunit C-terminal-like domain-containing protein [Casimicrobiaceae bacterium]
MSRVAVTYRVRSAPADVSAVAQAIAFEQSVELPPSAVHDPEIAAHIAGRVAGWRRRDDHHFDVDIELAVATMGGDVAQTVNMLFGNSSLQDHVELVDVRFPHECLTMLPGPRYGLSGLRTLLGAPDRPLTCAALKPQGLPVERLAALCETLARAGIDVIKDDHGLADQAYSPFADRVRACLRAIDRARAGSAHRAVYAPSIVGSPRRAAAQIRLAQEAGAQALLLAPSLLGLPAFAELVREDIKVPVIAHPSFGGATRIAHPLLIGTLYRALGADAVIFPHASGRFAPPPSACRELAERARAPLGSLAPALPVPAGGLQLDTLDDVIAFYGHDVMLLVGGSLLSDPKRVGERAAQFAAAARASAPTAQGASA